jgi:hypothetical protein
MPIARWSYMPTLGRALSTISARRRWSQDPLKATHTRKTHVFADVLPATRQRVSDLSHVTRACSALNELEAAKLATTFSASGTGENGAAALYRMRTLICGVPWPSARSSSPFFLGENKKTGQTRVVMKELMKSASPPNPRTYEGTYELHNFDRPKSGSCSSSQPRLTPLRLSGA